jgi:hypothetical protein
MLAYAKCRGGKGRRTRAVLFEEAKRQLLIAVQKIKKALMTSLPWHHVRLQLVGLVQFGKSTTLARLDPSETASAIYVLPP